MLIVIHGFNSSGDSQKGQWFKHTFPELDVQLPTYSHAPAQAIAELTTLIENSHTPVTLIGASLGGFYAVYLACRFALPSILINPLVDQTLLRQAIGPQRNYYTDESYEWTAAHCAQLDALVTAPDSLPIQPLVLLDEADETLDTQLAAKHFAGHADIHIFPGGSHRFEHLPEATNVIHQYLNN